MARALGIAASIGIACIVDWSIGGISAGFVSFPLPAIVAIYWFWRLDLGAGIAIAAATGFVMESASPFPFGVYVGTLVLIACLAAILKRVFSDTESFASRAVGGGILAAVVVLGIPAADFIIATL